MKKLKEIRREDISRITYESPDGASFMFSEDVEKLLGKQENKKFWKWMAGQTVLALPYGKAGVYPVDLVCYINGFSPPD